MTTRLDPTLLARAQLDVDVRATARFSGLCERKIARMTASSLAFLRGSAPLFYGVLAARPELLRGPKGEGWIAGDLHVENFGAYRTDDHSSTRESSSRVAFGMNDFDEAIIAPWRIDLLRLTTSLLLAARGFGVDGTRASEMGFSLLHAYAHASAGAKTKARTPHIVTTLVEQVRKRTRDELLDARTEIHHGKRAFVRGERYRSISRSLAAQAEKAFATYIDSLEIADPAENEHFEVIDLAQRIAGTGSLGCLRIAVLTRGKGGTGGSFVFDMKEEGASAASHFGRAPKGAAASRVIAATEACLAHPPRMLGATRIGKTSMLARRLAPQEDKLDLSKASMDDLADVAAFVGACAGDGHARGATRPPKRAWTDGECEELLERAIDLAGVHEAAYLAYARITGKKAGKHR